MHWNNSVTQSTGELHCGQQTVLYRDPDWGNICPGDFSPLSLVATMMSY